MTIINNKAEQVFFNQDLLSNILSFTKPAFTRREEIDRVVDQLDQINKSYEDEIEVHQIYIDHRPCRTFVQHFNNLFIRDQLRKERGQKRYYFKDFTK